MTLGLCLTCVIALVWAITSIASRPGRTDDRHAIDRRAAQLRSCPDRVVPLDLETLLSASLRQETVVRALGTAAERRIPARTLWRWADRFGADRLVLALDADVAEHSMVRHLDHGTTPDWGALAVFAGLNNDPSPASMPVQELIDLDTIPTLAELTFPPDLDDWSTASSAPATEQLDLSQFGHLPPIFGPGLTGPSDGWEPPTRDEDDDWPAAA